MGLLTLLKVQLSFNCYSRAALTYCKMSSIWMYLTACSHMIAEAECQYMMTP